MKPLFAALCLAAGLTAAVPARADYIAPAWPDLIRTLVRFNALSLDDPALIDDYTIVTECDLYKAFYHDDFKWNQVRDAVRASVKMNVATFPTDYHYDVRIELDRYDFDAKLFRFTDRSAIRNVNAFVIYRVDSTGCGSGDVKYAPRVYRVVLASPVYLDNLPLGKDDAAALLKRMEAAGNINRTIYARFNLRTIYVEHFQKETIHTNTEPVTHYRQINAAESGSARLDARLDSVDFYEDPAMTRLIYEYKPYN